MIPAPYRIPLERHEYGPPDARGNQTETWTPNGEIDAHSVSGPDAELSNPDRPGGRIDLVVYAPAREAGRVKRRDRLVIDGTRHAVAQVNDWTKGPWPFPAAGIEIHLQQIEGNPKL